MWTILLLDSLLSLLLLSLHPLGGSHSRQCDDGPGDGGDGGDGGPPLPGQEAGLAGTGRVVRLETVQV